MSEFETAAPEAAESISTSEVKVGEAPLPEAKEEAPSKTIDDTLKEVWRKNSISRDEAGRFKSESAPDGDPEISETIDQAPSEAPKTPVPNSWSAEVKAKWEQLPPDLQTYIAKRESETHTAISRQGQQIKALEPVQRILERGRETFQKYGISDEDGIGQLIEANNYLERDPVNAIRELAEAYGVAHLLGGDPAHPGSSDPQIAQLHQTVAHLQRQLHEQKQSLEQRATHEQERQVAAIQAQVVDFSKDKPLWSEIEDDIEAQIEAIKIKIAKGEHPDLAPMDLLTKAYNNALRTNDTAWAKHQAEEKAKAEKKRLEEASKRAADAKKSQPLNVKSSTANTSSPKTIDDTLRAIARRAYKS